MPSQDHLKALITLVEQSKFVEALQRFYAEDATMQENMTPPRRGLAALVEHERGVMASFKEILGRCGGPVFIEGDHAVINWVFEFVDPAGGRHRLDELAHQRWRGGKVVEERFYYDPAQMGG